ncbi:hypothetical protein HaLaN_29677 [Haematococcus lacustris]|uniref:Uncharacterized protein n=1 Tax=Haematococcus lacustris TaxID=44745 RepID=A0A6A0AD25_HAELA|nr:hypothetical protein HaLaN_29677 [Haematococcus lacustris]
MFCLACGRDDGSRDNWIPLFLDLTTAFGAAAGASALPAALLRLTKLLLRGHSCGKLPTHVGAHVAQ